MAVSSKTGQGLDQLIGKISAKLSNLDTASASAVPTRERHSILLKQCLQDLESAIASGSMPLEIRAELLRSAAHALGRITGTVDVEQLLGVIFSEFCIGK